MYSVQGMFETCETLVLRVSDMGWKEDESGTGERVLRLVKLEKFSNQVNAHYIYTRFYKYGAMFFFSAFYLDLVI